MAKFVQSSVTPKTIMVVEQDALVPFLVRFLLTFEQKYFIVYINKRRVSCHIIVFPKHFHRL